MIILIAVLSSPHKIIKFKRFYGFGVEETLELSRPKTNVTNPVSTNYMKARTGLLTSIISFITFSIVYDNFYTPWMISGTYVYNFPVAVADGPKQGDYLTLEENGNFESTTLKVQLIN